MNAISKATAFPTTVQPGIPKLGELPDGWMKAPLGRFLRETRRPIKMKDAEEYRLVTAKRARGGIVERECLTGSEIAVKSQFLLEPGDFLISKRQIVHGACGLVPDVLAGSIVSNEYSVLTGTDEIDLRFLNYLAHSVFFQQTCFHSSIGVHIEKMIFKLDRWLKWDFHLPPLPEQRKIAEILSTWDRAIETTEALLANARSQKRALMQSLLSAGSERPTRRFGDGIELISGQHIVAEKVNEDGVGVPYLTGPAHFPSGRIVVSKFTDEPKSMCRAGDVLITVKGSGTGKTVSADSDYCISRQLMAVRAVDFNPTWVRYILEADEAVYNRAAAGLIPGISRPDILAKTVPDIDFDEQERIGTVLLCAEQQCTVLANSIDRLFEEKKALMQQLLTGKRRVQT